MSNSPLITALNQYRDAAKLNIRNVYTRVLSYLTSVVPEFQINSEVVLQLDQGQAIPGWPSELSTQPGYAWLVDLVYYKGVALDMYLTANHVYLKFPRIMFKGCMVDRHVLSQWKDQCTPNGVSYRSPSSAMQIFEAGPFAAGRVPTLSETMAARSDTEVSAVRRWFKVSARDTALEVNIPLHWGPELIVAELNRVLEKYQDAVKKSKTFEETSTKKAYNQYVKYRANRLLAAYKKDTVAAKT